MVVISSALLIGFVAGLRGMTAPAAVSWGAHLGLLRLQGTPLAFLGGALTPYILTFLAVGELITDKLPTTPSRKAPVGFGARIIGGGISGAALGESADALVPGLVCGISGAVAGTLAGAQGRAELARVFRKDLPAALLEDVVAIGGAALLIGVCS